MGVHRNFIAGFWAETSDSLPVVDPSDGSEIGRIARGRGAEIDAAVRAGHQARDGEWGRMHAAERGRTLLRFAELIRRDGERLALLEAGDVGKPLSQARADAKVCARYFEYYGGAADKVHGETIPFLNGYLALTRYEPHGVTGHIVPWNYPLQMVGRSVAPALAMGNAIILKPAEDASVSALALAELAREAGFPAGAFNVVTGLGEEAGAELCAHPGIGHISFTGSREVGALVQIAAARNTIPVTLELGGKSPQIVFADADLEEAAATIVRGISQNAGQTCSAGTRALIDAAIYPDFVARLSALFAKLRAGPSSADLDLGPVISARQKLRVDSYLALAQHDGLNVVGEGSVVPDAPSGGFYVRPTLVADVPLKHRLAQEEIFGPVLVAMPFADEAEAILKANATPYGLAAGVWTRDLSRALRLSESLKAGQIFVNNYGAGGGVELPFGGVKASGHGREKGFEALYGFAASKTVAIKHGTA